MKRTSTMHSRHYERPMIKYSPIQSSVAIAFGLLFLHACDSDPASQAEPVAPLPVQTTGNPSAPDTTQNTTSQDETVELIDTEFAENTGEDGHTDIDHFTRFTDSNQDIWPPQPIGISNVSPLTTEQRKRSVPKARDRITDLLNTQTTIPSLIDARHQILTRHNIKNKTGNITRIETQIYNYDTDQVVTAELNAEGTRILNHTVNASHLYQPPESQAEVTQAIKLAALDLNRQGFTEHNHLNGTGLMAYPTSVQTAASGTIFYAERKIYVTFGTGNGELPQYRALVNLSRQTVESSGSIQ